MKKGLVAAIVGFLIGSFALADDWPQFRGPERTGVSKEKGLLKAWPKAGPKLVWTFTDAGLGHSSFAVVKGVLYTLGTDKAFTDEYVIAIDVAKGTELWREKIGPLYTYKGNSYGDGPRSTPTIDGNFLYALGGMGDLACIDLATKKTVWSKNLVKDLGGVIMDKYGFSEAPLIEGDMLICTPGGPKGTLAALDKKTGKERWRSQGWTDKAPFSAAIAATIQGTRQFVQLGYTGKGGTIAGVDTKGKVLWKMPIFSGENDGVSTSPVVKGNEVYVTAGFGGGCHLFEIDNKQQAKDLYDKRTAKKVKNTHGGVVLVGDHIYGHTENQSWVCQEWKTGSDGPPPNGWLERNQMTCKSGAIITAEGLLYVYTDDGEVGLVEADATKMFSIVSSFKIPQRSAIPMNRTTSRQSMIWAHPVIANGHLYLRDHDLIFAFAIK